MAADGVTALRLLAMRARLFGRPTAEALNASSPPGGRASTTKSPGCGTRVRGAGRSDVCTPPTIARVVRNVWMGGVYNLRRGGEACVAIEQGKWG